MLGGGCKGLKSGVLRSVFAGVAGVVGAAQSTVDRLVRRPAGAGHWQ